MIFVNKICIFQKKVVILQHELKIGYDYATN